MPSPVINSAVFGDLFGTTEIREIFSDRTLVQRYLDVEAVIAKVQGRLGIIPQEAADEIVSKCHVDNIDMRKLSARTTVVGLPIVGVVEQLVAACSGDLGQYAHWGATTQDIMDTADILQIREAVFIVERDLDSIAEVLSKLTAEHRDTVMAGRTHIQHAAPVTFGFKAAVWLSSIDRHRQRLTEVKKRLLVGQFGGAVGTLASLGDQGLMVQEQMMKELGLGCPEFTWHTARDNIAEITGLLALICGTLGKIGLDITLLAVSEINEVQEGFVPGRGSSSTMPQKRNPVVSEMLIVAAKNVRQLHGAILDAMVQDHERGGAGPWQTEWYALPDTFIITAAALKQTLEVLSGLEINGEALRSNIDLTSGLIAAESVMMGLGPLIGRQRAHDRVQECCQAVVKQKIGFLDALMADREISAKVSRAQWTDMINPANYLGTAPQMIDRFLAQRTS